MINKSSIKIAGQLIGKKNEGVINKTNTIINQIKNNEKRQEKKVCNLLLIIIIKNVLLIVSQSLINTRCRQGPVPVP